MTNAGLNQMQMAVLMPILNPFIDIIVERVSERVLSATMQKEPQRNGSTSTCHLANAGTVDQRRINYRQESR